jgi:predicted nucleic acid-binding protein
MSSVLVDSSVLLDIFTRDPKWLEWSKKTLAACADDSHIVINPIIYAEISINFTNIEELDHLIEEAQFKREDLPWEAAFLAGKCFLQYRKRGGQKVNPLPDFFIGAHAAIRKYRLLMRDTSRIKTHFPTVELISP